MQRPVSRAGEDDAHGRIKRRQHLRPGWRLPTRVRIVVALISDVGEIPVLMHADQLMLPGLVEKEAVGRLPSFSRRATCSRRVVSPGSRRAATPSR
jgi:hypothetical protein